MASGTTPSLPKPPAPDAVVSAQALIPDEQARTLADLVARRRQIVEMITAEGHRHREARDPKLARRIAAHIVWLRQELAGVECDLDDAVKASPAWRANEELLTSVPGVVTPRRAPRSPSCLSWAASTAPSSQPWSAWRRSTGTAAPCAAGVSCRVAETLSAPSCAWLPWWLRGETRPCERSIYGFALPDARPRWPSQPACGNSSPSSKPPSTPVSPGKRLDGKDSHFSLLTPNTVSPWDRFAMVFGSDPMAKAAAAAIGVKTLHAKIREFVPEK